MMKVEWNPLEPQQEKTFSKSKPEQNLADGTSYVQKSRKISWALLHVEKKKFSLGEEVSSFRNHIKKTHAFLTSPDCFSDRTLSSVCKRRNII